MRKELSYVSTYVGLMALSFLFSACAHQEKPVTPQIETPILPSPALINSTISPPLSPTATFTPLATSTVIPTPWFTVTPYPSPWRSNSSYADGFPFFSRTEMQKQEVVPYVQPGDLLGQVLNQAQSVILRKDRTIISISTYVREEYNRTGVLHPQILSPDKRLYFEVHNYDRNEKRPSEVRRWAADKPFEGSYILAARCDTGPNCSFRHPPAIDSIGLYGVIIKNDEIIRLFEVSPHHEDDLWHAPKGWKIRRVSFGVGEEMDDLYLEMYYPHPNDPRITLKYSFARLRDAVEHIDFPPYITRDCVDCTNQATHKMMEYNKQDPKTGDYPLRPPDKWPKLKIIFEWDDPTKVLYNFTPVVHPSSADGQPYVIYPGKEP